MAAKRNYKTLNKSQVTKVKRYTKEGKTQGQIAKLLHVSKQRVSNAQQKAGVGKRVGSEFWKNVKTLKQEFGYSQKKATELTKFSPKWKQRYYKRTGKHRLTTSEREQARKDLRAQYIKTNEGEHISGIEIEGEMVYETPK